MKVLGEITVGEIIAEHFGYDDYRGRWWEVYRGEVHVTPVVANPSAYPQDYEVFWQVLAMDEVDE